MNEEAAIYLIPNFHYDATWHKDIATFMRISSDILLEALDILDRDPEFRFVVDHATFLVGFLRAYPDQRERVRDCVRSGRLELVGGMYSMMDCDIPDGEAFARQLLYGQRWVERNLGTRASVGWFLDIYGFTPQLPQLLKQAGIDQTELCLWWAPEYMERCIKHSEFWWEGLDGSRILAHVAMPNYGGPMLPGRQVYDEEPASFAPEEERALALKGFDDFCSRAQKWATGKELLVHIGGDFRHPTPRLSDCVRWWNDSHEHVRMRIAVPSDFFRAIESRARDLPSLQGEISPTMRTVAKPREELQRLANAPGSVRTERWGRFGEGYGESKVERKQLDRIFNSRIRTAEKLATIASWLGRETSQPAIESLYQPVMVYQHHDPFIGCCVEDEYARLLQSLRLSLDKANGMSEEALRFIGGQVESRGEGQPFIVFNPLSFVRTDIVHLALHFEPKEAFGVAVLTADGAEARSQVVAQSTYQDGSLRDAKVLFVAQVPPLGYQVYFTRPVPTPPAGQEPSDAQGRTLENNRYSLALSPEGTVTRLYDKSLKQEILGPGAIELLLEEDLGCYCHIDTTGQVWRQGDYPLARATITEAGPLRWRATVRNEHKSLSYEQSISLYEDLPRLDFDLTMTIRSGEDLRARVIFPLRGARQVWAETPYGALERGEELAHAVNWVDCVGSEFNVGLLNEGLSSYELAGNALYLTLWRGLSMLNDCGGCLRRDQRAALIERGQRTFRYALYPHGGDWRTGGLVQAGQSFNNPLVCLPIGKHAGLLPASHSWLSISAQNVILNVVKRAEDGDAIVLRLYESHGQATVARLRIPPSFSRWGQANLLEEVERWSPLSMQEIELVFRPFEIRTIVLAR